MTHSITLAAIRSLIPSDMRVKKVNGEYRVNFVNGSEATAYYTNDAQDAIDTANRMSESLEDSNIPQMFL